MPLVVNRRPVGALGVDLPFKKDRDFDRSLKFYKLVAAIIAQAVKVSRMAEAERKRLVDENTHLRDELRDRYAFQHLVGTSAPIRQVYEQVAQVARTNTTVLIRGESGTGKEMIAHAIHYNSARAKKPFIKVSCAALPESLIESELFGYERGAFTGAQGLKKGRFELADGGTIFLDEIGDLSLATQVKLLRVLQEREFERLGGTQSVRVNVRLVAATHRPLEKLIAEGLFREDLFYRLNVFTVFAPPLRERKPDIMLLADHFLQKFSSEHRKAIKRISTPAIDMLTSYHWPGNVRELENTIERAVLVCDGGVVHAHHLPPTLQTAEASDTVPRVSLAESVEAFENDLLLDALKTTRGNRARAAKLLGDDRADLQLQGPEIRGQRGAIQRTDDASQPKLRPRTRHVPYVGPNFSSGTRTCRDTNVGPQRAPTISYALTPPSSYPTPRARSVAQQFSVVDPLGAHGRGWYAACCKRGATHALHMGVVRLPGGGPKR